MVMRIILSAQRTIAMVQSSAAPARPPSRWPSLPASAPVRSLEVVDLYRSIALFVVIPRAL